MIRHPAANFLFSLFPFPFSPLAADAAERFAPYGRWLDVKSRARRRRRGNPSPRRSPAGAFSFPSPRGRGLGVGNEDSDHHSPTTGFMTPSDRRSWPSTATWRASAIPGVAVYSASAAPWDPRKSTWPYGSPASPASPSRSRAARYILVNGQWHLCGPRAAGWTKPNPSACRLMTRA